MGMARTMGLQRPINGVITDLGRAALRRTRHISGRRNRFHAFNSGDLELAIMFARARSDMEVSSHIRCYIPLPTYIFDERGLWFFLGVGHSLTPLLTFTYTSIFLCMEHLLYAASSLVKQPIRGNKMRE